MTRYFLKRLQIEGFRGINNEGDPLDLKFKTDSLNSVFAPNGLGKSSIYDALSYAIRSQVPKLDSLHVADKAQDYYANRFHSAKTSTIHVTLSPDDGSPDVEVCIKRSSSGVRTVTSPTGHPHPASLLQSLNNAFILVDHRTFLRFVEDSPLDRGRTFSSLLGLGELSEFRQALETLSNARNLKADFQLDTLETQRAQRARSAETHLRTIRLLYRNILAKELAEPIDQRAVVDEITQSLARISLIQPFFLQADITTVDYDSIRNELAKAESSDKRSRLAAVVKCATALELLAPVSHEQEQVPMMRSLIEQRDTAMATTRGPLFRSLYRTILEIIDSGTWEDPKRCPACESQIALPVADAVRPRLQQYETVIEAQTQISSLWESSPWVTRFKSLENDQTLAVPERARDQSGITGRIGASCLMGAKKFPRES